MALLGKISAVLTANTRDFTRRIGESRRELQDFARQARGIQFNLNTRALDGTLTQLQRFQRTLREIQQLQARNVDAGLPNTARLRDQFRAFEDIGRPLTQVRGQIEGLANSLQSQLYPELGRVQSEFQGLYRAIGEGSTTYEASRQRIDALRTSLIALGRATAAVGDFDRLSKSLNANNSGGAFFQPRALESLQRSLSLRGRAQEVPAAFRSDVFGDLAVQAEESAERVARAAARVARYQLEIATAEREGRPVTSLQLANRGIAQRRLDNETSRQNAINLSFQRELDSAAIQQIVSPGAERQVTTLRERLAGLATELRAINGQQFNGLISGAAAVVEQFNRGTASAREAKQAVDALAASLNAANTTRGLQQQTESLLFTPRDLARRSIQSDYDRQVAGRAAGDPLRRRAEIERTINLTREGFNAETIPRTQGLASQARALGTPEAERQANRILEINRQINAELTRATNLNNNNQRNEAVARLQRIAGLLAEQRRAEAEITDQVEIRNAARRQEELFLQSSGGSAEQLSQGSRDAAADISVARQFRGQIASGASRIAIQGEIDRVTNSVVALQQQMAKVAASDLGLDKKAAELDRLDNEIRQSTKSLAAFVAAQSNGAYSVQQIENAMRLARNQAGSLTTRGTQVAQLAFQQGLFAIDDLISATGGLEYKLRAVGNNITQLGLLLGQSGLIPGLSATTGLFIGLAAVIGGQAISALLRYATGAEEAEKKTKALNDALARQNASVARQKATVEQLAGAYKSLGESIGSSGVSQRGGQSQARRRQIQDVLERQRSRRAEIVEQNDAGIGRRRAKIKQLEAQLETESSETARNRIRQTIRNLEATIDGRLKQFEQDADILINRATANSRRFKTTPQQELSQRRSQVRGELAQARRVVDTLGAENAPRWVEKIDSLSGELAALEVALQKLQDARSIAGTRTAFEAGDQLGRAQSSVSSIPGFTRTEEIANQLASKLESLVTSLGEAEGDAVREAIIAQINAASLQAKAIEQTAISLESFSASLDRAAGDLSRTVESELASQADNLRRRANAAEAEFGADDRRTIEARRDAGQIEAARRRATENRQQIEAELSARRQRFEADAANGVGNADAIKISGRLRELEEIQASDTASASQKEAARLESDQLRTRLQGIFDALPKVQDLRRRADLGDVEAQRQIQDIEQRARGRELAKTPAEVAAEEVSRSAADLQAEFKRRAARNPFEENPVDPAQIEQERRAAFNRLAEQRMQQEAPMLAGFREERLNAMLQGPSRAALNVADAQTMEGSRELNRLLRGDDPNKDVNLVELQKQSELLQRVIDAIEKESGPGVVEIRG